MVQRGSSGSSHPGDDRAEDRPSWMMVHSKEREADTPHWSSGGPVAMPNNLADGEALFSVPSYGSYISPHGETALLAAQQALGGSVATPSSSIRPSLRSQKPTELKPRASSNTGASSAGLSVNTAARTSMSQLVTPGAVRLSSTPPSASTAVARDKSRDGASPCTVRPSGPDSAHVAWPSQQSSETPLLRARSPRAPHFMSVARSVSPQSAGVPPKPATPPFSVRSQFGHKDLPDRNCPGQDDCQMTSHPSHKSVSSHGKPSLASVQRS